jgi:putative transcriptional regulator
MKRRRLFAELMPGVQDMEAHRKGKITLRELTIKPTPPPRITAKELIKLRTDLRLSRTAFAYFLRTNPRTLEGWEQGRAKPNPQAALLIRLVEQFPDTVSKLAAI